VPGKVTGESDVVIDLKHAKPWRLSATLDDSGSKSTGQLQAGLNLAIDNLFGINDLFNIGINNDADNSGGVRGTRGSSAYYSMPMGNLTFTLSAGASHYQQQVNGTFQKFMSSGKSTIWSSRPPTCFIATRAVKPASSSAPASAGAMPISTTPK